MTFIEPKTPDASDSLNLLVNQITQEIINAMAVDIPKIIMRDRTLKYHQSQNVREVISIRDSALNANDQVNRPEKATGESDEIE